MVVFQLGLFGWMKSLGRRSPGREGKGSASASPTTSAGREEEGSPGIILYQQNDILNQRIPSLDDFADYIKAVQLAGEQHSDKGLHLHGAAIVVGVRPGREARVWFVPDAKGAWRPPPGLKQAIETVPAPVIRQGPVAFAIVNQQSHAVSEEIALNSRPIPAEWHRVVANAGGPVNVNEVIERAWR